MTEASALQADEPDRRDALSRRQRRDSGTLARQRRRGAVDQLSLRRRRDDRHAGRSLR